MSNLCNPTTGLCPPGSGGNVLGIQPPVPAAIPQVPASSIVFAFDGDGDSPFPDTQTSVGGALLLIEDTFANLGADGTTVLVPQGAANGDIPVWNETSGEYEISNICDAIVSCPSNLGGGAVLAFSVFLSSTFSVAIATDNAQPTGFQKRASTPNGITFDVEEYDSDSGWATNKYTVPAGGGGVYVFDASIYSAIAGGDGAERSLTLRIVPLVGSTRDILLDFTTRSRVFSSTPPVGTSFNPTDIDYLGAALHDQNPLMNGSVMVAGVNVGDQISLRFNASNLATATSSGVIEGGSDRLTRFSGLRISA